MLPVFLFHLSVHSQKPLLTVNFTSGDISLMNNYDDLSPTLIRTGLKGVWVSLSLIQFIATFVLSLFYCFILLLSIAFYWTAAYLFFSYVICCRCCGPVVLAGRPTCCCRDGADTPLP